MRSSPSVERRRDDVKLYFVLETLEYLKRGGRISPAQAAIGTVLSVKPIITVEDGVVETVDRPRTRGRARARLLELLSANQPERVWRAPRPGARASTRSPPISPRRRACRATR